MPSHKYTEMEDGERKNGLKQFSSKAQMRFHFKFQLNRGSLLEAFKSCSLSDHYSLLFHNSILTLPPVDFEAFLGLETLDNGD